MKKPIRNNCLITFKKKYFVGTIKKPKFAGYQILKAIVKKNSYGKLKNQHTFTIEVLDVIEEKFGFVVATKKQGEVFLIKGRNLYPYIVEHIQGEDSKKITDKS